MTASPVDGAGAINKIAWTGRWSSRTARLPPAPSACCTRIRRLLLRQGQGRWINPTRWGNASAWRLGDADQPRLWRLEELEEPELAFALVKHLTSVKWATKFAQIRRVLTANIEADKAVLDAVKTDDPLAHTVMQTQLEHTDKMTGNWPLANDAQIKEAFWPEFQNAVLGRKDAKTALADAERGVAKVLRRA